ncbi:MAG: VWA domain-containing protein [Rubripirellula sp.]
MSDFEIGSANSAHWIWLVAAIAMLAIFASVVSARAYAKFASPELIDRFLSKQSRWRNLGSLALVALTMSLLVACLVDVRWGKMQQEVPQKGIEVIFLLDVSRSMLAEDITPNRLKRAKQMIKDTVDEMAGDRVGLAIFAGEARQRIPLTSHYEDFKQTLDEVQTDDVMRGGSSLGDAIRVASEGFLSKTNEHKAIVLLTDGGDEESKPVEAAQTAKAEQGVRIFTIGLGDMETGARIPSRDQLRGSDFVQFDGQQVWSKLNGDVLSKVATETGGAYIPAGTKQVNMADVYHGYIANVEEKEFATAKIDSFEARFQWFLFPALVLLLLEVFWMTRKSPV